MSALLLLVAFQAAPPDEAACRAFVRKLEESVVQGDGKLAERMLDGPALLERSFKDAPGDEKNKAAFSSGILRTFTFGSRVSKEIREQDGSYTFLRFRTEGGARRALFRLIAGGAFNYHDYLLEAGPGGTVRATDIHVMLSGEWLSESFRRAYVGYVASQPGMLGKLTGRQNEYAKVLQQMKSMTDLMRQGKHAEALKVHEGISAEGKKDKMVLLGRYQAAQEAAPETLPKIIEDFEKAFPGDACLPAVSIDAHLVAKRYDRALAAIDLVDQSVGGDPYLHVLRAGIHVETAAFDKARAAAAKAVEQEKTLAPAYWMLVTISLEEKKHADTAAWLTRIEKDLGLEIGDLAENELYADFVKSAKYKEWLKGRKK
jgi:hypothetical protein